MDFYICGICGEPFGSWGDCWDCGICDRVSCPKCHSRTVPSKCEGKCVPYEDSDSDEDTSSEEEEQEQEQEEQEQDQEECICNPLFKEIYEKYKQDKWYVHNNICVECDKFEITDECILDFLLKRSKLTKEEAIKKYKKTLKRKDIKSNS